MRLRTMNRRRWRRTQPFHITQTEHTRRRRWHIWKFGNIWDARWRKAEREEGVDNYDAIQARMKKGIVVPT